MQTGRAELDLPERLLAGNIQHAGVPAHLLTHLEQKRGFADAGLTANEHERKRASSPVSMSPSRVGRDAPRTKLVVPRAADGAAGLNSLMVFHAPQDGHFPYHFGDS